MVSDNRRFKEKEKINQQIDQRKKNCCQNFKNLIKVELKLNINIMQNLW